ncbi:GNAT family N-acetyltransferase [Rhodovulum sp. BSW8]|uniref:GNAT family N-acetyltransferase n=1 Tax=Rhodovulum sp. BSW8 TaxID=2259645 RepID=UPI000DE2D1D4|nr:GNAT family N-acetyltransferase [Rhodovulum sp. BSW8]RBO51276.1 GNAT family N-acetyltransferase [Rhodovulum sp. BSW8]
MIPIVPFDDSHLADGVRLSQQAGWPHRREDWALVLSVSTGVAALDAEGRVVGTAFCSAFGDRAALNMIIVDAALRGQGLGRRLMEAVIALAGDRALSLVATPEGRPLYEKLGFAATGEIVQHQGEVVRHLPPPGLPVRTGGADDLDRIAAMDRAATGADRRALLTRIAASGRILMAEGGFAMLREFGRGTVLGPLAADTPLTARALIAAAAQGMPGRFLRIDTRPGLGLGPLLQEIGLPHVGGGTEMHRGPAPRRDNSFTTHALASQALG